jgi:hypothetical protein
MSPKIKFSHEHYTKLDDIYISQPARLVAVQKTHYDKLPAEFRAFDCEYKEYGDDIHPKTKWYPLSKTDLLLLLFMGDAVGHKTQLFVTLRRWTPKKQDYYESLVGELFEIEFTEEEK